MFYYIEILSNYFFFANRRYTTHAFIKSGMNANHVKMNRKYQDFEITKSPQKWRKWFVFKNMFCSGAPSLTPTGAPVNFAGNQ